LFCSSGPTTESSTSGISVSRAMRPKARSCWHSRSPPQSETWLTTVERIPKGEAGEIHKRMLRLVLGASLRASQITVNPAGRPGYEFRATYDAR
jgi:hypothetical protein